MGSVEEGDQRLPTGGSWPLGGQGHVRRQLWALWSFDSLSADRCGCVPAQLVVWPELAQHLHLQVIGWAGLGAKQLQQERRMWPRATHVPELGLEPNLITPELFPTLLTPETMVFSQKSTTDLGAAAAAAKSLQLCLTLCDPIDGSPRGSPIPGILQARIQEWVAISFSSA